MYVSALYKQAFVFNLFEIPAVEIYFIILIGKFLRKRSKNQNLWFKTCSGFGEIINSKINQTSYPTLLTGISVGIQSLFCAIIFQILFEKVIFKLIPRFTIFPQKWLEKIRSNFFQK